MKNLDVSLLVLVVVVALTYIPGSPTMYLHMVNARKKALSGKGKLDGKKET